MSNLNPEILKRVINGDNDIKAAIAVLHDNWNIIYNSNPLANNEINNSTINLAKKLQHSNLIDSKIDFNNYNSVHNFIIKNDKYINAQTKQQLLSSFD